MRSPRSWLSEATRHVFLYRIWVDLTGLEPMTPCMRSEQFAYRTKGHPTGFEPTTNGTYLISTSTHQGDAPSLPRKDLTMTTSASSTPRQFVAIPRRPTLDDARAFMEFLAREHPDLHAAIVSVELAYAIANEDLNPGSPEPGESGED